MKKSILVLGLAALFGTSSLYAANEGEVVSSDNNSVVAVATDSDVDAGASPCGYWTGRIGGYEAEMSLCNGRGDVYLHGSGSRSVSVKSFKGGKLILNAYMKGKYIGYYSGTYSYRDESYVGVFYNTKTGGKVNFYLYLAGAYD